MTKANREANDSRSDAERRARRKLNRLKNKGIATGNISPFRDVDTSDTRAVKSYTRELESFISRENRYVGGFQGTPIPYSEYRDLRRMERKWNKVHNKYWEKFGPQPFIIPEGPTDMSLAMRSSMGHFKSDLMHGINYERSTPAEKIRGIRDIEKRKAIMLQELDPKFQENRAKVLKKNMLAYIDTFNDPELKSAIKKLNSSQLFKLQTFTDFVPLYYHYINTDRDNKISKAIDAQDDEQQRRHLKQLINNVSDETPTKPKKRSHHSKGIMTKEQVAARTATRRANESLKPSR